MGRGFGATEKALLQVLKNSTIGTQTYFLEEKIFTFTFKQLCKACKKNLTKEQVHSALGRLVKRGTVWKTNGKRPQEYWILPSTCKLII